VLVTSVGYRGGAALAEGLRRTIAATPFVKVGPITASLGVTEYVEGESAQRWFERTDQALLAAKSAGRNRMLVDRQGNSDLHANRAGAGVLRLYWLEAYECGEPTIDAEHRALFDFGNALIAAALDPRSEPGSWRAALDSMLAHLLRHFQAEEALLTRRGYGRIAEHQRAHAGLLQRAEELRTAVEAGNATLGQLVNFIVNDVIALHVLRSDRDFYLLLRDEDGGRVDRAGS
jgi:hemerythrin-like metal-binding protein